MVETKSHEIESLKKENLRLRQRARSRRPRRCHSQDQAQVYPKLHRIFPKIHYTLSPPPPYPIYNAQPYGQFPSYPQWRVPTLQSHPQTPQTYQSPSRPDFRSKPNNEMRQKLRNSFTPIGESYAILFQRLVQQGMIASLLGYTLDPHLRSFDPNVRCAYHSDVQGHSIEDCRALKREIEKMLQDKSTMVQNIDSE